MHILGGGGGPKPRGKYSVSACCAIWRTLSVVVGPLFAEQNTPLQPLRNRLLPVQLPPRFSLAPADSRGRVEVTVDSIQTVQTPPLSAVRVVPCSAEQYSQTGKNCFGFQSNWIFQLTSDELRVYSLRCLCQWLLKCCAIRMDLNISPDQVKLLYSQAGKPLEYVDQKFSYDSEVEVSENVRNGMSESLHRIILSRPKA